MTPDDTEATHPRPNGDFPRRSVRSFVVRAGRMTVAQERAWRELWPRLGIEDGETPLDFPAVFGRTAPLTLEIGFGNGESLAALSHAHPERDFLGIEVHRPGVGHLMLLAEAGDLRNVRVICRDAVEVLERRISDASSTKYCCTSRIPGRKSAITSGASYNRRSWISSRGSCGPAAYSASRPTGRTTRSTCSRSSVRAAGLRTNRPMRATLRGPKAARSRASRSAASGSATMCGISRSGAHSAADPVHHELRGKGREQYAQQATHHRAARHADHAHDRSGHEHQRQGDGEHQYDDAIWARNCSEPSARRRMPAGSSRAPRALQSAEGEREDGNVGAMMSLGILAGSDRARAGGPREHHLDREQEQKDTAPP